MKIGILGTGMVGRSIALGMVRIGNHPMIGTRDVRSTMAKVENGGFAQWSKAHPEISVGTFRDAAEYGKIVVNATSGMVSIEALKLAGAENLKDKILIDIANELDFSGGMPPHSLAKDADSLAERIQAAFPETHVVKTLNTMNADLMINPLSLANGQHSVFVSGDDPEAKETVKGLLSGLGWKDIIDLGDITSARGPEMLMPIWLRLWGAVGKSSFNYLIVR